MFKKAHLVMAHPRIVSLLGLLASTLIISGCAGVGGDGVAINRYSSSGPSNQAIAPPKQNVTHELVKQGVIYLREGDYESAQKVFSASVKVSPNSSTLHLLNGISYHLKYLNNSPDSKELAETAYGISSTLDRSDPLPLIQLGRLHIDSGDYAKASKDFVAAYAISPSSQDAVFGLLQASLLQKDFKTALWAGESLKKSNTTDVDKLRLMALTYAAVGKSSEASQYVVLYSQANRVNPKDVDHLKQQIAHISSQLSNLKSLDLGFDQASAVINLSKADQGRMIKIATPSQNTRSGSTSSGSNLDPGRQGNVTSGAKNNGGTSRSSGKAAAGLSNYQNNNGSSDDSSTDASSTPSSVGGSSSGGGSAPNAGMAPSASSSMSSGGGGGGTYTTSSMMGQKQRWFDCDTRPGLGKAPGGSYGVPVGGTTGDQTLYLEPLPSPCNNAQPPKMASIDAVLIRTVDTQSSSFGINLLTGLQIFAGSQRSSTTGSIGGQSVTGVVNASVLGVGNATSATLNGVSGLISYTMNIANSTSSNSQVIARPTLTALDRIPSTFYSGNIITAGLNGGGVSGAQVTNIPTGVSLSVTPTFVDEESMMLAVKVSRSFVSGTVPQGGFNAGISTDQHAVTANVRVKYGETLILDGLTSRSTASQQDGVPVLQDIPIIQYLFNNLQKQLYSENVLVLVTPRRMLNSESAQPQKLDPEAEAKLTPKERNIYSAMKIYGELLSSSENNLDGTLKAMDKDSTYFRSFKSAAQLGSTDKWVTEPGITKFMNDAANLVYFTR